MCLNSSASFYVAISNNGSKIIQLNYTLQFVFERHSVNIRLVLNGKPEELGKKVAFYLRKNKKRL